MFKPIIFSIFTASILTLGAQAVSAQNSPADTGSARNSMDSSAAPDNTKSNRQDSSNRDRSADKQKNDSADVQLTQRIRRSVIADKSLSRYGHNVKIVTANGTVTLNGVVRSDDERAEIERQAASIAGKDHVVNEIKVAPRK